MTLYNSQLKDMALALSSKELQKIIEYHQEHHIHYDNTCPKCKEKLEFESDKWIEIEFYYCSKCDIRYEVDVEITRFWKNLREVE